MLTSEIGGRWGSARRADAAPAASSWGDVPAHEVSAQLNWGNAQAVEPAALAAGWGEVPSQDLASHLLWGQATDADGAGVSAPWAAVPVRDAALGSGWDRRLKPVDLRLVLIYNPMPARKDAELGIRARRVNEFGPRFDAANALAASLYVPGAGPLSFSFGGQHYVPSTSGLVFFDFRYVPATPAIQPTDSGCIGAGWRDARRLNLRSSIPWGNARVLDGALTGLPYFDYVGPVKPLPPPAKEPALKDTYMIANMVNAGVLPERTPIELQNVSVTLDRDSHSWGFSADVLTRAALNLVRPGVGGAATIELEINGHIWHVLVERYSRNLRFADEAYKITGGSRTVLLGAPYAPKRTLLNDAPLNARQAAENELLYTDFELVWDTVDIGPSDWTFPTEAFSYQEQSPIEVISRVAATVGAFVRPAMAADELEIRPRYPVPPWEYHQPDAPVERVIPCAMMSDLSGEWTPQPHSNACYTSGTAHGVSMLVRRAGTAGDKPTADVHDDWLTDQPANRARGVHELASSGDVEIVGFTLPLFHKTDDHGIGLVLPGMLCHVPDDDGGWYGVCLSVDISASGTGASEVNQVLKLERNHSW